jgi:hypothetical protein
MLRRPRRDLPIDTCQALSDLAIVIETWDKLSEAVRAGIVAMVMAITADDDCTR